MPDPLKGSLPRYLSRQAVGGRFFLPGLTGLLLIQLGGSATQLAMLGVFLIAIAIPHAAIALSVLEQDGRFDHLRAGGRSPQTLFWVSLLGLSGPWLLLGGVASAIAAAGGAAILRQSPEVPLLIVAVTWAAAAAAFAMPRVGAVADPRLILAGVGVLIFGVVAASDVGLPAGLPIGFGVVVSARTAVFALLAVAITIIAASMPRVLARFVRPIAGWQTAFGASARTTRAIVDVIGPIAGRGVLLTFRSAIALGSVAAVAVIVAASIGNGRFSSPLLVYIPLLIGSFAVAITSRSDADARRLELLYLAPTGAVRLVSSTIGGLWISFILVTVIVGVFGWWLTGEVGSAWIAIGTLAIVAPLSATEGWHRRAVLVYSLPFLLIVITLLNRMWSWPMNQTALTPLWRALSVLVVPLVGTMTWHVACHALRRPSMMTFRGWTAIAAATVMTASVLLPRISEGVRSRLITEYAVLAIGFLTIGAWFTSPLAKGLRPIDRLGPILGVGSVSAAFVALSATRLPIDVFTLAVLPAAIFWITSRTYERLGVTSGWSIGVRAVIFMGIAQWPLVADSDLSDIMAWLVGPGTGRHASRLFALTAVAAVAFALALEVLLAVHGRMHALSTRSGQPPAR